MDNHVNSKKEMNYNVKDILSVFLFIAVFLIIWQIVFSLEIWPRVSLPSPAMVAPSFFYFIFAKNFLKWVANNPFRFYCFFIRNLATSISTFSCDGCPIVY